MSFARMKAELQAKRDETFAGTSQLTLGELLAELSELEYDNDAPVQFAVMDADREECNWDGEATYPTGLGSWRGSYRELAIRYTDDEDDGRRLTAGELTRELEGMVGDTVTGYKGGTFAIHEDTPVWVANSGYLNGPADYDNYGEYCGVVGAGLFEGTLMIEIELCEH